MSSSRRVRGNLYGQATLTNFVFFVMVRVALYNPLAAADQLICAYFLPWSGPAEEYKHTVGKITLYIDETPRRSCPILAVDLKDGVGTQTTIYDTDQEDMFGKFGRTPGHYAAEKMKDIMLTHDLAYADTFSPITTFVMNNKNNRFTMTKEAFDRFLQA